MEILNNQDPFFSQLLEDQISDETPVTNKESGPTIDDASPGVRADEKSQIGPDPELSLEEILGVPSSVLDPTDPIDDLFTLKFPSDMEDMHTILKNSGAIPPPGALVV